MKEEMKRRINGWQEAEGRVLRSRAAENISWFGQL